MNNGNVFQQCSGVARGEAIPGLIRLSTSGKLCIYVPRLIRYGAKVDLQRIPGIMDSRVFDADKSVFPIDPYLKNYM
jgi:hypothetical protein